MAMRHWLTFEMLVEDMDSDGSIEEVWAPAFDIGNPMPAEVAPLSGRELIAAAATQSKITHRIRIRYRAGINAKMRAVERETFYNIEAVIPDQESGFRFLTLLATSGVNAGGTA
jgi:SPP1 family predicted phage head-tail adaptor